VVETWGSAPRPAGAKMAIRADLAMVGSVSGGCVETAVVEEALAVLKYQQPALLHYGISDDAAWDVGLACGGRLSVLVEPLDAAWWALAAAALRHDTALTTCTRLDAPARGAKLVLDAAGAVLHQRGDFGPALRAALHAQPLPPATATLTLDGSPVLVERIVPRPHLILIGGVHVATHLQDFARTLGFRVTLIDPRRAFATRERFPHVAAIHHDYPAQALARTGIDADTYLAILTHDPKIDDPALLAALHSPAAYIGVLSSRRTHEKRLERLRAAGLAEALLHRLHTPIGLEIGAQTPEEIALCIMAEIVAVRRQPARRARPAADPA
nr:XdhC family protein [Anaerolineae bacterium]